MIYEILAWLGALVTGIISGMGYWGVFLLMALESACIPIPSEVIMPFSGFLVWQGTFHLIPVVIWGALGNLAGSIIAYGVGFYGGRPLLLKYGKYLLISESDLDKSQEWFKKHGSASVLFARCLPIVRTFISLPAGIAKMPFWKFCLYTFLGSLPFVFFLTYGGVIAGENWNILEPYFRKFDWLILIVGVLLVGLFIIKKLTPRLSSGQGEKK
jgi:membrane protein DedA with SNARE-associated domain